MLMQALKPNSNRTQRSKAVSLPAPFRGWVTEENIISGTSGTALLLDNWFPEADAVRVRKGFEVQSDTGETAPVETIMAYHKSDGTQKLFAASNATIYDVTSSSPAATSITSLTNTRLQFVNFAASTTNYLFIVNGDDSAITFDGTTWANPSITGITSANITNLTIYKRRLFFTLADSLQFAYLPVDNVAGAASTFDLGPEFAKGGYLQAIGVWTVDGGSGQDDHICFVTSEGQVAIYQGDDPSDANSWAKVGTYDLPRPIGRRCLNQVGGDVYLITDAGILALRESLALDISAVTASAITKNIQSAVSNAAVDHGSKYGWQLSSYPKGKMAILNVPLDESTQQVQYVMNSVTGAWSRFTGMNACCWAVLGNDLYFGGNDGVVYKADAAASDNGSDIVADYAGHYDFFGSRGRLKDWKMIQAIIYSDGTVSPAIGLNIDFIDKAPKSEIVGSNATIVRWDEVNWDEADWPAESLLSKKWISLANSPPGYAGAVRIRAVVGGTGAPILMQMNAFNLIYEVGNPL